MTNSNIQQIIERYLSGNISTEDEQLVDGWLDSMADVTPYPGKPLSQEQTEQLRRKLLQAIRHKTGQQRSIPVLWWRAGIAAAILVLLFAGYLTMRLLSPAHPAVYLSMHTAVGERKMLTLPDSTHVWLAPNSTLQYPENYTHHRNIRLLSGEAYFDVVKNAAQQFTVNSGSLLVEVLGTSFNIRAYNNLPNWQLAVNTGKVRVVRNDSTLGIVNAGESLEWNNVLNSVRTGTAASSSNSRMHNRIYFDETPLPEALKILENYYPVHFTLQHRQALVISGALNTPLRVDQVITVLEELTSHNIEFQQTGNGQYLVK